MPKHTLQHLVVLFADIAGSVTIYEKLGDAEARQVTHGVLLQLGEVVKRHQGRVIKTIGDELMCAFSRTDEACRAAIAMQQEMGRLHKAETQSLSIRIGIHSGKIVKEDNDLYGDAVNIASRLTDTAKADQIIISRKTLKDLRRPQEIPTRKLPSPYLKGKKNPIKIAEILFGGDQTLTVTTSNSILTLEQDEESPLDVKLLLRYRDQQAVVCQDSRCIKFGRDPDDNQLIIDSRVASRTHGRVELRYNAFYLVDESTNASVFIPEAGEKYVLHRETEKITENGRIMIGIDADPNVDAFIEVSSNDWDKLKHL